MDLRRTSRFIKLALACAASLAFPGAAFAVPTSITGPATIAESATEASYTVVCGDEPTLTPLPEPNAGTLTVTVSPGPNPPATKDADYSDPDSMSTTIVCPAGGGP